MGFDPGTYRQSAEQISKGMESLRAALPTLQDGVAALSNISSQIFTPEFIKGVIDALVAFGKWATEAGEWILKLIEGIAAPLVFYEEGGKWRTIAAKGATDAQSHMNGLPIGSSSDPLWTGLGAEAYKGKVPHQISASARLGVVCDTTGQICVKLAIAGAALYVAVLSFVLTITGGLAAVIGLIAGILSIPLAPPTAVTTAAVAALIVALITACIGYISETQTDLSEMTAMIDNDAAFPGPPIGSWPHATAPGTKGVMDDGTVTDGDADWSVPRR